MGPGMISRRFIPGSHIMCHHVKGELWHMDDRVGGKSCALHGHIRSSNNNFDDQAPLLVLLEGETTWWLCHPASGYLGTPMHPDTGPFPTLDGAKAALLTLYGDLKLGNPAIAQQPHRTPTP